MDNANVAQLLIPRYVYLARAAKRYVQASDFENFKELRRQVAKLDEALEEISQLVRKGE